MLDAYKKFFVLSDLESQAETDRVEWAESFCAMLENKACIELLDKIEQMTNEQIAVTQDVATMAGAIGRQNGRRDVLAVIKRDASRARRIIAETRAQGESDAR